MTEAQWAGAETGNGTPRLEWLGCRFRAMKNLQPVAHRIAQNDQILDASPVGEGARATHDLERFGLKARRERVQCAGIGDFPTEKADTLSAVGVDDQALLAVVHTERERGARSIHALQAEKA